jgi:hypothetical protein
MSNSINNKPIQKNLNQRQGQVFDIKLDLSLIESLQASINNLNDQISPNDTFTDESILESEEQFVENESSTSSQISTTTSRNILRKNTSSSNTSSSTKISRKEKNTPSHEGKTKRSYTPGADRSVKPDDIPDLKIQSIQVPFLDRQAIGSETQFLDGSVIQSKKNNDGTILETLISPNGSTTTKTYEDYPLDKKGNPTGFRTTIVDNNYNLTVLSTIINDLGNGNFSTVTTDITNSSNPTHVMSSALVKNTQVKDDDGNNLYNSNSSRADGIIEDISHENINFDDVEGLRRPSGYRTSYNSLDSFGNNNRYVTETISYTDENGKRVTVIYDVTDPNSIDEISRSFRDDPFTAKKKSGSAISSQLDKVNNWGLLNITGDDSLDPSSDLLLIARYLKGYRGSELTQNINLGQSPLSTNSLEERISKVLNRGLLDIVGTSSETNNEDLKILARYMMGARGEVLLDKKSADDDSIKINSDGTNVLTIDESNPLLGEIQEIFGVNGKKLEFNNSAGSKQNYRLFYVNTTNL